MSIATAEELYEQYIKLLSPVEKLRLVMLITRQLLNDSPPDSVPDKARRSIMELQGLGAEIWQDIDPQEYINQLRDEWDNRQ